MSNITWISSQKKNYRRLKAITVVFFVWSIISLMHVIPVTRWFMLLITFVLTYQAIRMLVAKPKTLDSTSEVFLPIVTILVPAKNESIVLPNIIESLFHLDYPETHLDIWIINDASTDNTRQRLEKLQLQFPALQVYHREYSSGGKSGALNAVFSATKGEIILVCDADAEFAPEFLTQTVALFKDNSIGAVQVRKTITNRSTNFLTRCQQMEMSCDAWLQTHRLACGGMAELRGSGMFIRRQFLEQCNGWNENTVTDDLDLVFRLYIAGAEIQFITAPAIKEQGVITWSQLWHQRYRWSLGGYQRYLDYLPQMLSLGWKKELDLFLFLLLQFILPIGLIPDLLWTIYYSHNPVLFPLQTLLGIILTIGFIAGLYQFQNLRGWSLLWTTLQGSFYMLHWIPIMIITTLSLCIKPEQLNWVKTEHYGN
jgi:1,2-diacylglycerol 3-beta-glucosyltransferase